MSIDHQIAVPNSSYISTSHKTSTLRQERSTRIDKICLCVQEIFLKLKTFVCFPLRYLGSKTWSIPGLAARLPGVLLFGWNKSESITTQLFGKGYEYHSRGLTPEESKPFLRNACIASSIAVSPSAKMPRRMEEEWLDPYGLKVISPKEMGLDLTNLSEHIEVNDRRFLDPESGLKVMMVTNEDEVIIAFGAAGAAKNEFVDPENNLSWKKLERHIWNNIVWANLFGASPEIYRQADKLYTAIKDHEALKGKKITLVGHCLGGSLASYVGLKHGVQVNGFNTLAFGAGIQKEIGDERLKEANKYLTHISISKDFFSDCPKSSIVDRIVNLMGIRTPGNFGKHYTVPAYEEYNNPKDGNSLSRVNQDRIHNFYVGSMMAHVGFSNRDKPVTLVKRGVKKLV